ncbi:Uncharacterized protein TCM_009002 [Theobroma cacao]|uniref:Uncharacterized protein n=1 Tax=Theobroma cacao TaxID=3641 RepID=A0A061E4N3_THECC|nr:Uncharacterized protein TCM_009002 [Theobroma cacao]
MAITDKGVSNNMRMDSSVGNFVNELEHQQIPPLCRRNFSLIPQKYKAARLELQWMALLEGWLKVNVNGAAFGSTANNEADILAKSKYNAQRNCYSVIGAELFTSSPGRRRLDRGVADIKNGTVEKLNIFGEVEYLSKTEERFETLQKGYVMSKLIECAITFMFTTLPNSNQIEVKIMFEDDRQMQFCTQGSMAIKVAALKGPPPQCWKVMAVVLAWMGASY